MNSNSPNVSIIVPVYNAEGSLRRCVDSLLAQTLNGIEIVIVDDGSSDGSIAIIDEYAARFPQSIVAIHRDNCGVSAARNAGLRAAGGRYIGFTDSDDYAEPAMFEKLYHAITGNVFPEQETNEDGSETKTDGSRVSPFVSERSAERAAEPETLKHPEADIAICRRISTLEKGTKEIGFTDGLSGKSLYKVTDADSLGLLIRDVTVFLWDKLYDSEIIDKNGLTFNEDFVYSEDFCFLQKYLYFVKRAALIDEPLYHYTAHSDGSLTNVISDKWYHILGNLNDVFIYYKEKGLYDQLESYMCDIAVKYYDRRVNVLHRYGRKVFQRIYVKDFFGFLDKNFTREVWERHLHAHPDIIYPGVKGSLFLMTLYIFMPNFIKKIFVSGVMDGKS
ncbi:MAG: glycosyltransferase [Clostridiales Family XIII bacterium]|jgi:glycosyltransferase involved in cell wall biosynthesis|nr:glycosyltransferase [Clostridiales Family XIII bacterium]